jgi:hypothetical protein
VVDDQRAVEVLKDGRVARGVGQREVALRGRAVGQHRRDDAEGLGAQRGDGLLRWARARGRGARARGKCAKVRG